MELEALVDDFYPDIVELSPTVISNTTDMFIYEPYHPGMFILLSD